MFNPKITKGKWDIDEFESDRILVSNNGSNNQMEIAHFPKGNQAYIPDKKETDKNIKSFLAVPELLEVYKAATKLDYHRKIVTGDPYGMHIAQDIPKELRDLEEAIKNLEDRHCK